MVEGLNSFKEKFKDYKDCYTVIGGTACEILMEQTALSFRETRDIDMVLIVEEKFPDFAEFYEIINGNGGFDVIIGNPPYVVYTKKDSKNKLSVADIYDVGDITTKECNNLYAFVIERCYRIISKNGRKGMIIPISSVSNPQFEILRQLMLENSLCYYSSYSNRPGKLFQNVEQRLTIYIAKIIKNENTYFSCNYNHWYVIERKNLFDKLCYVKSTKQEWENCFTKVGNLLQQNILEKIYKKRDVRLSQCLIYMDSKAYFHNGPTYFIRAMSFMPNAEKDMEPSSHYKLINCNNNLFISAILNSSLYYWFYKNYSNCRDFSDVEIKPFPIGNDIDYSLLNAVSEELKDSYKKNRVIKNRDYDGKITYYEEYYPAKSKIIIDKIDTLLAKHYGFTEEELDFIINYDIKYRMGNELEEE